MAEIVACHQERTKIEYELMRKNKVFSDEHIRAIMKTRENFQYKLNKSTKNKKDFMDYIINERKLIDLVVSTEVKRKEQYPGLRAAMASRVIRLYKEVLHEFPTENRFWNAYITFCKTYCISELGNVYDKLIQKEGHNPTTWCNAAIYFHDQGNNMEKVKTIFFRGLQRHPESEMLYKSFLQILLSETANQEEELREANLERVIALYNTAKKKICDVNFLVELFDKCNTEKFSSFSRPLQKLIIHDMLELYPREEAVWDVFAQCELRGPSMTDYLNKSKDQPVKDLNGEDGTDCNNEGFGVKKRTLKRRIETCFSVYQAAVRTLKTPAMWAKFLNAMLELNNDLSTQKVLKRQKLIIAFKGAHESNCMSEDHYYAYINVLNETKSNREFLLSIMKEATDRFGSLSLWEQRMTFHVMEDNEPQVYEVFRRATRQLGGESYPLWKLALQYYQTRYDDQYQRLVAIFKEACTHTEPAFATFRPQYLEWSVVNQPFHVTRRLYTELTKLPPPCLDLHKKMAMLESLAIKPDVEKLRECYENAVAAFGKVRTDVWIDYIKFERSEGHPKQGTSLFERAQKTLEPKYVDNFITEHCLLTIGI